MICDKANEFIQEPFKSLLSKHQTDRQNQWKLMFLYVIV